MSNIITNPNASVLAMFQEGHIPALVNGIAKAVALSFVDDKMHHPTEDEKRRRSKICLDIVRTLRGDYSWGMQRIVDNLPHYLHVKLNGGDIDVSSARSTWVPTDGD